jgi:hypothetical protein
MKYFSGWLFLFLFGLIVARCSKGKTETGSASSGVQRFEKMDPAQTGVTFTNLVKESKNANYFTANYLYIGGGVGAADFNKDGLTDLYFVSVTGENKLYFNKGNFRFEDVTAKAGVGLAEGVKTGVSVVDINADGLPDIFQCRTGQVAEERGNKLFVNKGDGTFAELSAQYGLNTTYPSTQSCFFDYDLDGDLDMYLINRPIDFSTNSQIFVEQVNGKPTRKNEPKDDFESDRLFANNGNGTFSDVSQKAGIWNRAFSLSVNVLDVNEDGYPDVYVANDYLEPDHLYVNQRNGTFKDEWKRYLRHLCHFSMGADIADFNNDGKMDIVTLDMLPADNFRQKQNGTVMRVDRYTQLANLGFGDQIMRNMLQLNNGNGGFNEIACLAGVAKTDWSWAPLLADFDNDGWKDLFITNGMKKDVGDLDFANYTLDSLRSAGVPVEDFGSLTGMLPSKKLSNYMYRNTGGLRMEDVTQAWGFSEETFSNGAAYADLDNDGDLDIVVHNTDDVALIYKNKSVESGDANFLKIKLIGSAANPSGFGARVKVTTPDGVQTLEKALNRGFLSTSDQDFHIGLGKQTAATTVEVVWPDKKMQTLSNVPAKQALTIQYKDANQTCQPAKAPAPMFAETSKNLGLTFQHFENNFQDFDRERLLHRKFSNKSPCLAAGDVNGDGLEDLYIGGSFAHKGEVFVQEKSGKFKPLPQAVFNTERKWEDVDAVFFDANGDKAPDLYIVSGGSEAPMSKSYYIDRLLFNDGKGNFGEFPGALPPTDESGACVTVFDFDKDGDLDVARGGSVRPGEFPRMSKSFLLQNNGGRFTDVTSKVAPELEYLGIVNAIRFEDLNKDGTAEMLVAGEWLPLTVFENTAQGYKINNAKYGLEGSEGWWNCLQTADFNGDGYIDIAAGNLGLNCRLSASPTEPVEVFGVDIDQNGSIDPILSFFIQGKRYPLSHRDNLIKQVPAFKKQFVRYRTYSNATLDDVLTPQQQQQALHLKATVFANSIFYGSASGKFERKDLPDYAQTAPIMDMAVKDLNGDGLPDLVAVGNDYGLEVESGRLDAGDGWLLAGSKEKGLTIVPNPVSGIWASGEGRKVRILQHGANQKPLIVVANNNGFMQAFE